MDSPAWRLARITPNLYVGGQHYPKGWQDFLKEGITAIVNMREEEYDDAKNGVATEKYLHLPTIDNTPPTLDMLQQGADFIADEINNGGKVYVHCKVGVGRASTMAIAYLISQGMTRDEAIAKIKKVRPFIHPTWRQLDRLAEFEQMVQNQDKSASE